jgi:drug/metabolite transporter (DMT)-like permease
MLRGMAESTVAAPVRGGYTAGVGAILLSSVLFSVMAILIRFAHSIDFFTISFYRFAVGTTALGTLALFRRIRLEFTNSSVLFLRGLFGGISVLLFYMSVVKLGLARGTVLSYLYPIFAAGGGVIFLKDRVSAPAWVLMGVGLGGLALLVAPKGGALNVDLWTVLSIAGAVSAGAALVCLKRATATDSSYAIFLAQCVVGFWLVAVPAIRGAGGVGWGGGLLLVAIGLTATAAQVLMTWGFGRVSLTAGSLLGLLTPLFNVVVGIAFFAEAMGPAELAGSVLVLLSCVGVVGLARAPAGRRGRQAAL